jgi:hypothetical protein
MTLQEAVDKYSQFRYAAHSLVHRCERLYADGYLDYSIWMAPVHSAEYLHSLICDHNDEQKLDECVAELQRRMKALQEAAKVARKARKLAKQEGTV